MARLSRLLRLESSSGESLDSAVCTSGCHSLRTSSSLSPAHRTARSKLMGDQTRSAGRATQKGQETPRRCRADKTLAEPDAASQAAKQSPNNPPTRDPGTSRGTHTHSRNSPYFASSWLTLFWYHRASGRMSHCCSDTCQARGRSVVEPATRNPRCPRRSIGTSSAPASHVPRGRGHSGRGGEQRQASEAHRNSGT